MAIWDTEESEQISSHFAKHLDPNAPKQPEMEVEEEGEENEDFEDMDSEEE